MVVDALSMGLGVTVSAGDERIARAGGSSGIPGSTNYRRSSTASQAR
jgi:hypothetical protein